MTSVIIPVYNGAAILPTTIPAVLALDADEILWVDDGSRDATPRLLADATAGQERARVITLGENAGRAAARNAGVATATGDVLAFFDADVEPPPGAARALAAGLGAPGAVASVARLKPVVTDPGDPYQDYVANHPRGPAAAVEPGEPIDWRYFLSGASAVRREAFERVGGFPEAVPYGEDVAFGCRLARVAPDGLRLARTVVRLHDLGDLARAVGHARQFGAAAASFDEPCPGGAVDRVRAPTWVGRAAAAAPWVLASAISVLPRGALRRRAVRYLLAATALRAAHRA
ncbi:glycosyltransferase [Rubrivirga marina]|uniref:Glycosyltransferase 2-like domain-containing protein n=1 Tax=Rubrivirga marina TaxID=1196024 RepID=A0A271J1F0_9BACT|nr:glycosyltransferase [Rubrivirga marina]PAP77336.1 hypothetical protein BSZ37_13275 [Rubrivirga marina]